MILALSAVSLSSAASPAAKGKKARMKITSPSFAQGALIPPKHTCQGADSSPELVWEGEPAGTKSLALIVDDPDAPGKTWVHWVIFNIPPGTGVLDENLVKSELLANGTRQGRNDFGNLGWGGPCPPTGAHRYYFRLYALDAVLNLKAGSSKEQLLAAMKGHILGEGLLLGLYQKQRLP